MSFPRYKETRSSGIEWLGDVPSHWRLIKLRTFAKFFGGGTPSRENLEYWNGDIPWVSPKDMKTEYISNSEERITEEGLSSSSATLVPSGSVLIVVRSGILKHTIPVAISTRSVALNQDLKALIFAAHDCSPKFFMRWVQGLNNNLLLAWSKQGATVESIEHEYLSGTFIPLPPLHEQITITSFLDRETSKIDSLIAEQTRLIELLKEKRQAVISHAVTKGLNPDAPMKDSGIEWLGEVPEHWHVKRLRWVSPQITVGIVIEPSKYYVEEGVPALRSLNVRPGSITTDNLVYISDGANELHVKSKLRAGDLVAVRTGQPGTCAVVPDNLDGCNCVDLIIIRHPSEGSEQFLCWYLASEAALRQFSEGSDGAIQQHFNIGTALDLLVVMPPNDEQRQIANWLDSQTADIDALAERASRAVALLQERRSALISAAVTGKIDVRNLTPTEHAEAAE